jgi:transposase
MEAQVTKQTRKRKRRHYTPEFKAEVVALIESSDKSIGRIATELDLPDSVVRSWVAAAQEQASPAATTQAGLEAENQELRKRIRELEMERAILKKATAFFAKESS